MEKIAKPPQRRRQVLEPSIPKSSNQKDPSLVIQEQRRKQNHQETPKPYTTINIDKPLLATPEHPSDSWAQYQAPTLASPAQRLVVGVVVVGGRHCSPACTVGCRSPASMTPKLLLLLLPQLLRGNGHLDRLAVPARPAPPRAARRP
jgi:hypothetical protein